MKKVSFHGEARLELLDQISYYEKEQPGLGQRFRAEIESAVALAASQPFIGSRYKYGTRRVFPRKFPCSVVYIPRDSEIVILAVAHFRRKPGYWRTRRITP